MDQVIVVDTETGGLDPDRCAVLSIALVAGGGRHLEVFVEDPTGERDAEAMAVNGIDPVGHAARALSEPDAARALSAFVEEVRASLPPKTKLWLAGHNIAFDIGFVRRLYKVAAAADPTVERPRLFGPHRSIDTHTLLWAQHAKGALPFDATSSEGAFTHFGIAVEGRHTALGDAVATRALLERLIAL